MREGREHVRPGFTMWQIGSGDRTNLIVLCFVGVQPLGIVRAVQCRCAEDEWYPPTPWMASLMNCCFLPLSLCSKPDQDFVR